MRLILIASLLLSGCASSSLGRGLNLAVVGSGIGDYVTTRSAMDRGAAEANPVLGQGAIRQAVIKAVGIGAVIGLAQVVEQQDYRVWSHLIRSVAVIVWTSAAIHNGRVR